MPYTAARIDLALDAANNGVAWAILHDGAPGAAGTDNQLAESTHVAISLPASAAGSSEDVVIFTITGASGPITNVSLWTDSTGSPGTFVGSGVLDPQETFGGAGELEVTVTTTASST